MEQFATIIYQLHVFLFIIKVQIFSVVNTIKDKLKNILFTCYIVKTIYIFDSFKMC